MLDFGSFKLLEKGLGLSGVGGDILGNSFANIFGGLGNGLLSKGNDLSSNMDFSNIFSSIDNNLGNNLSKMNLTDFGNIYGAINSGRLTNKAIDSTDLGNKLAIENYEDQKKRREKVDNSFASVWG